MIKNSALPIRHFEHKERDVNSRVRVASLLLLILSFPGISLAQYHLEVTPFITTGEEYNDNLFLDKTNKESDYITTVSPGFNLNFLSQHTTLGLSYSPTFVWYAKNSDLNPPPRQSASLTLGQELSQHWTLNLSDSYLRTEQEINNLQGYEDVEGVRRDRKPYWTNNGNIAFNYLFGPEDAVSFGYRQSYLENESDTEDNGRRQGPFGNLTYWFDIRNGMELDCAYTKADFWRNQGPSETDDYTGYDSGIRYLRRFSPHTTAFLGGRFTTRNFDGPTSDYNVYDGSIGLDHSFSQHLSLSANAGYYIQKPDDGETESGPVYGFSLTKQFNRGQFTLGGNGGWREHYLEAESRGFVQYWGGNASVQYQLLEPLSGFANLNYIVSKDENNREWKTWYGNCGLSWALLRWLSTSLNYSYEKRIDDVGIEDYTVNRVMLFLTASTLYRW
jgi:hypothetical protein